MTAQIIVSSSIQDLQITYKEVYSDWNKSLAERMLLHLTLQTSELQFGSYPEVDLPTVWCCQLRHHTYYQGENASHLSNKSHRFFFNILIWKIRPRNSANAQLKVKPLFSGMTLTRWRLQHYSNFCILLFVFCCYESSPSLSPYVS